MDASSAARLSQLNQQFYQTFAVQFSQTRQRLQPGVQRILERLPSPASLLDLGCGNGQLARALTQRGQRGVYIGLDFSPDLLSEAANSQAQADGLRCIFRQADLAAQDWDKDLPELARNPGTGDRPLFHAVLAFAVLHHLPGEALRRQVLEKAHSLLSPEGWFFHSEWQFLNSPRLVERIQPWERLGLAASQVDPGDYLLDWRQGGRGLRYVHHFQPAELESLAQAAGFTIRETFLSDGESGNLGLYQVWQPHFHKK